MWSVKSEKGGCWKIGPLYINEQKKLYKKHHKVKGIIIGMYGAVFSRRWGWIENEPLKILHSESVWNYFWRENEFGINICDSCKLDNKRVVQSPIKW
jgi:hypothetical protein